MVSRSELINRMLSEQIDDPPYLKNRMWTSLADFVKDNLQEVDEKIQIIDNCIWGKVVVMEKNTRIAKAYLRNPTVSIDGSSRDFDGARLGLGAFSYLSIHSRSNNLLSKVGKGIDIFVDFLGNISMSNRTGRKIYVESQDIKFDLGIYKEKIFDLRKFKQTISKCSVSEKEIQKIKEGAIIWIQFSKGTSSSALDSPLWLCLIHVIAVEMVSLLAPQPSSSSGASSVSNLSHLEDKPTKKVQLFAPLVSPLRMPENVKESTKKLQGSSPIEEQPSPPRWTAPRRRKSENFYEQCTRDDNNSVRDREEALYSMPEATTTPPVVAARTASKENTKNHSPNSSHSSCPTPSTEITRVSRFTQQEHEKIAQKRGGVRKRLEKSLGPPMEKSSSVGNLANISSSSIIDLRTLANLRRPVYFQKPVTNRSGSHFFI